MGKTHLMHAIGQYLLNQNDHLELTYISSERFMNEMINPVRYDRILEFRERYRTIDLLLVDDIQSLTNNSLVKASPGLKVLEAMLEEDRAAVCGPRYAHQSERQAYRAGHAPSDRASAATARRCRCPRRGRSRTLTR